MTEALATAVLLGGLNALIDFVSTELRFETRPLYLVGRVVLMCLCTGAIIGARARQLLIGVVTGILVGLLLGAGYHELTPTLGSMAFPLAWGVFWLAFCLLDTALNGGSALGAVLQGLAAAALSGLAFYALSIGLGKSWSGDMSHVRSMVMWTSVFAPGFVVLFWRRN